jgi:hypothetical protein
MTPRWLLPLGLAVLLAGAVRADVFHLTGGGRIEGELLNAEESPRTTYVVRLASGGTVTLARKQVERVENRSAAEKAYRQMRVETPDTIEGHAKLAEFCRKNSLLESREFHLQEILRLDPDHAEARYGLGYSKVKDRWVRTAEYMRERGYVLHKGSWRTPQEVAIEERNAEFEAVQKQWKRDLKLWRGWVGKKREREGEQNIQAVDDWRAAQAVVEMLDDETTQYWKLIWIDVLGRLHTHTAWTALVRYALEDDDEVIRVRCITKLEQSGTGPAVGVFVRALDDKDNVRVNRAGIALGRMQDPSVVPALIEHLVTKHKVVQPGTSSSGGLGPIGATFGGGGTGLNTGSPPQVIDLDVPNQGVFSALVALTRQNFGSQDDWRRWYIETHTPKGVNLRRGE